MGQGNRSGSQETGWLAYWKKTDLNKVLIYTVEI